MEEGTVTVDSKNHKLPTPFMVIATQNEVGYVGTYPLPEAQLDRFLMKISMGYPTLEQEIDIITDRQTANPIEAIRPICSCEELVAIIDGVRGVHIEPNIYEYIVKLVAATRSHRSILLGASPRASLMLMRASQSCAFVSGRAYVVPEDVQKMVPHVLSHRLMLTQEARIRKINEADVLSEVTKSVAVPFVGKAEGVQS
jgi:MoxR-like ATPase